MQQKTILMRFFFFGISTFFFSSLLSCDKGEVDYAVRGDFVYINETNYPVIYKGNGVRFNVAAHDTLIIKTNTDGGQNTSADQYEPPLHDYCYPCYVSYDNIRCDTLARTGPANIKQYANIKKGTNYYEFVYRYTQQNMDTLSVCQ